MQGIEEIGQTKQIRDKGSPVVPSRQAAQLPRLHRELAQERHVVSAMNPVCIGVGTHCTEPGEA